MQALIEAKEARSKKINKIEDLKTIKTPMEMYASLDEVCKSGVENIKDEDAKFFFKCLGFFFKPDNKFMLRIRITGGQLTYEQAIKLGEVSQKYGEDYIDITTRQQLEFRFLPLETLATVLRELQSVGISTFQTGVDNFRGVVTSSFDGLGEDKIIECKPLVDGIQSIFLEKEDWIGTLPRKFNTAILGNKVNDCNIYGHDCCFVIAKKGETLGFNLYLAGKNGVQATDSGLFVKQEEVVATFHAVIELFKKYGFRDNRNKNRLFFLLEAVGMDAFVDAIKQTTNLTYESSGEILCKKEYTLDESGVYDLGEGQKAVHFSIPSGVFTGTAMRQAGELAKSVNGKLRLSVEQSFFIICDESKVQEVQTSELYKSYSQYHNIYFNHQIACAGTHTCSFGVIPNKPDAIDMANYLNQEVPIKDGKVRMYWSACPKACGIHGVADIGFEGCKAKDEEGNTVYGVHIFLGGKATKEAKEARVILKSVPLTKAREYVKNLLVVYRDNKEVGESFESFEDRYLADLETEKIAEMIS